ncbi:T9SS type A sorting domain-containing protein [Pseudofulvibacter geojedonensis]|uniref:T9SS type A sorting domain-containing protein n=1 Tax=Pseudofulvibacter geojedonensis TaxID=1123758 RepID=A0ABW3I1X6_9FLAO
MKKTILSLSLFLYSIYLCAQIQLSNFTYNNISNSSPAKLQEFNNKIFLSAATDNHGRELWSSDGTATNTNLVIDIEPGESNGLELFHSTILNNELFFAAKDDPNDLYGGGEIWKTDGTETGSVLVTNYSGRLFGLTTVNNLIYFTIKTNNTTLQIWKTDGSQLGTVLVKDNIAAWNHVSFQGSINGKFIFTINISSTNKANLWRSDGTEAGTYELTGEIDGNGSGGTGSTSELSHYIVFNENLYFISRYSLHKTDGTIVNTNQVANVWNAQTNIVNFGDIIEINGKMYFSFYSKDQKKLSIYESDGTTGGTSEIYTITSSEYFYPSFLVSSDDNLIFSSINSTNGTSIFSLDTVTHSVTEIVEVDQNPQEPFLFFGRFSALSIDKLDGNLFYVNSPKDTWPQRKGWIFDKSSSSLTPIPALDGISIYDESGLKIVYNNDLYYSKNYQLWKYDTNALSVELLSENELVNFSPNPSRDFIEFNNPEGISEIKIYDINGQLIIDNAVLNNNKIDLRKLVSGTYFLTLKKDNKTISKKIIKVN